ncbi:MAG: hypothetical protein D6759_19230, partial [Chloroflexi bacterium]
MSNPPKRTGYQPLTWEQLEETIAFFRERLVGQPEVVETLAHVLYKQNALLKRAVEHEEGRPSIPADPTVLLLAGGSWGKSLAARLIPMALARYGQGSLTVLTPLPQDPEGTLYLDPRLVAVPFATIVVENIEVAYQMNVRFVGNLAHVLSTGLIPLVDETHGMVHPIPLGLATFVLTTGVADAEIRQFLHPEGRLGFLPPETEMDPEEAYEEVRRICERSLRQLPPEILRQVDETVILRPLGEDDLRQIFDLEIAYFEQGIFPGRHLPIRFEGNAHDSLFQEARQGLEVYGVHALRRVLQRYIDPVVYRAYNAGQLTEENLEATQIVIALQDGKVQVRLVTDADEG